MIRVLIFGFVFACVAWAMHLDLETVEAALSSACKLRDLYETYKSHHGLLRCKKEHPERWALFKESLKEVRKMKRNDEITWDVGVTPLSDLSDVEYENMYLGYNESMSTDDQLQMDRDSEVLPLLASDEMPETFDWRSPDPEHPGDCYVTPVQHQKEGSCWARAALVPIEAQIKLYTGELVALSPFEAYDCTYGGENGYNGRKGGGRPKDVYKWLKLSGRISTREAIPDRPGVLPTHYMRFIYADTPNHFADFVIDSIRWPRDENQLVNALWNMSPVVISIQTKGLRPLWKGYKGKPFWSDACTDGDGHAMAVVGYNKQSLIIKNSWGTHWGDKGYLMWERGHAGWNCHMFEQAVYPIVDPKEEQNETS